MTTVDMVVGEVARRIRAACEEASRDASSYRLELTVDIDQGVPRPQVGVGTFRRVRLDRPAGDVVAV